MTMTTTAATISTHERDNEHMRPDVLGNHLARELEEIERRTGEGVVLELLGKQKTLGDATTKILVRTRGRRPVAVAIVSRAAAPDLVARGTRVAAAIRAMIGPELGSAIIQPIAAGSIDGRSYELLPYCRDISVRRPTRLIQRRRFGRPLLDWLARATHAAVAAHDGHEDAAPEDFRTMLEHLQQQALFERPIQDAVDHALHRIDTGRWTPRHAFDHNDLYLGNIMLPTRAMRVSGRSSWPFILIDWAGANPKGYGIYDLVRLARALNLSRGALGRELREHCDALRCDFQDLPGHLLAACGRLHRHLEHFPEAKFIATVRACWTTIDRAMGPVAS